MISHYHRVLFGTIGAAFPGTVGIVRPRMGCLCRCFFSSELFWAAQGQDRKEKRPDTIRVPGRLESEAAMGATT